MNGKIEHKESFNKVKIFKPKAVRLCPPRRKQMNSTFTQSNFNQGKKVHKANKKQKKKYINLEDISIDEINKDFKIYKDNMEEEHCHNELLNIINNSCENKNGENNQKIKRFLLQLQQPPDQSTRWRERERERMGTSWYISYIFG